MFTIKRCDRKGEPAVIIQKSSSQQVCVFPLLLLLAGWLWSFHRAFYTRPPAGQDPFHGGSGGGVACCSLFNFSTATSELAVHPRSVFSEGNAIAPFTLRRWTYAVARERRSLCNYSLLSAVRAAREANLFQPTRKQISSQQNLNGALDSAGRLVSDFITTRSKGRPNGGGRSSLILKWTEQLLCSLCILFQYQSSGFPRRLLGRIWGREQAYEWCVVRGRDQCFNIIFV